MSEHAPESDEGEYWQIIAGTALFQPGVREAVSQLIVPPGTYATPAAWSHAERVVCDQMNGLVGGGLLEVINRARAMMREEQMLTDTPPEH